MFPQIINGIIAGKLSLVNAFVSQPILVKIGMCVCSGIVGMYILYLSLLAYDTYRVEYSLVDQAMHLINLRKTMGNKIRGNESQLLEQIIKQHKEEKEQTKLHKLFMALPSTLAVLINHIGYNGVLILLFLFVYYVLPTYVSESGWVSIVLVSD